MTDQTSAKINTGLSAPRGRIRALVRALYLLLEGLARYVFQAIRVEDSDQLAVNPDQTPLLESCEHPADGFCGQAQVAGDVPA